MKKLIYSALSLALFFTTSCSNDDILVETDSKVNDVNVSVSLSNFFSSYDFYDSKHDINIADEFRSFHSEANGYIQVRTLFYNSNGVLVDSLLSYSVNTNTVTSSLKLSEGQYTAISTLTFASKTTGDDASLWTLVGKEKLSTAYLECKNRFTKWSILSYQAKSFTVTKNQVTSLSMSPSPIGALGYLYFQDFQYKNSSSTSATADNNIRALCVYSQNVASGYKLDPNATEKYLYLNDAGTNSWYYLSDKLEPSSFDTSWTYFQSNLYDYFYILAPRPKICFGYVLKGESTFHAYGEGTYTINSGRTYLSYWDWFQVGNPYFGIADNNHWNNYNAPMINSSKETPLFVAVEEPRSAKEMMK